MEILKTIGKRLLRTLAAILISAVLVIGTVIGLPFVIVGIIIVAIFAPDDWGTKISVEVDPNLDIDN